MADWRLEGRQYQIQVLMPSGDWDPVYLRDGTTWNAYKDAESQLEEFREKHPGGKYRLACIDTRIMQERAKAQKEG